MMLILVALSLQLPSPLPNDGAVGTASASLAVETSVGVSSVSPILLREGRVDGPVVIGVDGDPGRAYRLQVQSTLAEAEGSTRVVSAASGDVPTSGTAHTGSDGFDQIRIFGATPLLSSDESGRTVMPLRIVYE